MNNAIDKLIKSGENSTGDSIPISYKSEITDVITYADGHKKVINHGHNIMLNSFLPIITSLLAKGNGKIAYWAIGKGEDSWDENDGDDTPIPVKTDTGITNEVYRKAINSSDIKFLDDSGSATSSVTNIIEISVKFTENEGLETNSSGDLIDTHWRCFGIVGGPGATATLGSGYFMNEKNHKVITKTDTMIVERKIKFTFTNGND